MTQQSIQPMVLMITIVNRGRGDKMIQKFIKEGITFNLLSLAKGTASSVILDYLGIGETLKEVLFSTMQFDMSKIALQKMREETSLNQPGEGIAFTIPINSVCGHSTAKHLVGHSPDNGGTKMEVKFHNDLIIAIVERGYCDEVMDAAKSAKAVGGTILKARGTGFTEAEKFFGITIQPEKEMVLILTSSEYRQGIMEAISRKPGLQEKARTIMFSLPVNDVAGLPVTNN